MHFAEINLYFWHERVRYQGSQADHPALRGRAKDPRDSRSTRTSSALQHAFSEEANSLALFGLTGRAPPGAKRMLVSAVERKCVVAASHAIAARQGFTVETIPVDQDGTLDLAALEAALGDEVLLATSLESARPLVTLQLKGCCGATPCVSISC